MEAPKWEFLVEVYGEARALKMLEALESIYLANHMRKQAELNPNRRLARIFDLIQETLIAA